MKRRILSFFLTCVVIFGLLPTYGLAADHSLCLSETEITSSYAEGFAKYDSVTITPIADGEAQVNVPLYVQTIEANDILYVKNDTGSNVRGIALTASFSKMGSIIIKKNATVNISDATATRVSPEVTKEQLIEAGLTQYVEDGIQTYYFIYFSFSNRQNQFALLARVKQGTVQEANKNELKAAIGEVTGSNADNWYHEGDCFNGKNTSESGFWIDLQPYLQTAQNILEDNTKDQPAVDAATEALKTAIANLIPTTQVNATGLYEAVQAFRELDESDYTSGSWAIAEPLYDQMTAMLAELFDEEGDATNVNTADRQGEADALVDQVVSESGNYRWSRILVEKTYYDEYYETYQARLAEARNLVEQYDPSRLTEADYTPESWNAYKTAWETLRSDVNHTFSGGTWADYQMMGSFPGHIDGLTSARLQLASSGDVTISFTYVDNMRSRYPEMDESTEAYRNGSVTLDSGSTTLSAALEEAGITYSKKDIVLPGGGNTSDTDPFLAIYFNGECVGTSYLSKLEESTIQIPNNADVRIVRCAYPLETMEASTGYDSSAWTTDLADSSADYSDSFALIDMTAPETAAVGDKVEITGSVTGASYSNLGQDLGGEGLTLFVSEPSQTKAFSAPSKETVTVTGADGTLEYVFTRPGWYTVALFDMREDVLTATDIFGAITTGTYYSLRAGDFALIHVTEAANPAALLEQYRTEKAAEAKAFFEQYHDYDFTAEDYAAFQGAYDTLQSNLSSATDFTALMDQYDTDYLPLRNAAAKAMDHEAVIADLRANLAYLPGDLSTMDETYADLLTEIRTVYQGLNAHQKSMLTGNEIALLDQAAAISPDSLTKLARVTVTFYKPEENEYPFATIGGTFSGTGGSAYHNWPNWNWLSHQRPDGSIPDPSWSDTRQYAETMTAKAGDYVYVRLYLNHTDDQYWPMWSVDSEETWNLFEPATYGGVDGYYLATWQVPEDAAENSTYHIDLKMVSKTEYEGIVAEQDTEGLEEAKTSAKAALQATYNGYDLSKYDDAGKTQLKAALEDGLKAIDAATTTAAVTEARKAALAAMASVKTIDGGSSTGGEISFDSGKTVGKVHVIIENTTYADGPFYGEGSIADGWYDLGENDTMMTMALKVLQSNGYAWNGTTSGDMEAADYTITYISSITKDGQTLAEFTGGNKSGWMGTLNDWFVNEGFQAFGYKNGQLENNDEIHIMYTCDYGVDLHGDWNDHITTLEKMAITGGTLTPSFDGSVTDYTLVISDTRSNVTVYPVPVNKNYQHRIFLNDYNKDSAQYKRTETISVTSGDVIYVGVGEQGWPTMNSGGSPTKYTIRVYSLAEALSNLPAASAVTLSNYTTYGDTVQQLEDLIEQQGYTGDRSKLDALKERVTFYEEIDEVKELLADIPDVDDLTIGDRDEVQDARDAYDALNEEQKLYITIADVEKFNAAVEWMEEHGSSISGGTIAGVEEMPEEVGETGGGSITITPEATVNSKGEATATVDDEAVQQVLEQAAEDGNISTIVVAPEIDGDASKVTVELPKSSVGSIADDSLNLEVSTPIAGMTIPSEGLSELAEQSGSTVSFTAEAVTVTGADGSQSDAIRLDVAVNGRSVDAVPGGMTVTVPAADAGSVLVLVADDGTETIIRKSVTEDGEVAGLVDGSCTVKVVDNAKTFTDTAGHWAEDAIDFASSRELFNGTSATAFSPNEEMTRAMLVTVLHRLEDEPETAAENAFADIPDDTWYTDAVIWASENGIVNGVAEGQFDPNANITREQLAAMMYRYANFLGMDTTASGDLSRFRDGSQVSSWASDAMQWAVGRGLISGKSATILDPKGNATRAEVATILQRMTALMVK